MLSPHRTQWEDGIIKEWSSLKENEVFTLVQKPPGIPALPSRFVFRYKPRTAAGPEVFKARLVVGGHKQQDGINYDKLGTYAPVASYASLRIFFALMATLPTFKLFQIDFKTAFLNSDVGPVDIYMRQPQLPASITGSADPSLCYLLKKSLYGLKQSPRNWHRLLTDFLLQDGWTQSKSDPSVFTVRSPELGTLLALIGVYVDDVWGGAATQQEVDAFIKRCSARFQVGTSGPLVHILGIEVERQPTFIKLTQQKFITSLLEEEHMDTCNPVSTPWLEGDDDDTCPTLLTAAQTADYRRVVGKILYLANTLRPDLAYSCGRLASRNAAPTALDRGRVRRLLRYIKGTMNGGLTYRADTTTPDIVTAYSDADWANCKKTGRSITGLLININGAPVDWQSKRQPTIAHSTAEAEYMAANAAAKRIAATQNLLGELGYTRYEPTVLYCDNQAAIALASNQMTSHLTRHMNLRYHYVREEVERYHIKLLFVKSEEQHADIMTKQVKQPLFSRLRNRIMGDWGGGPPPSPTTVPDRSDPRNTFNDPI
jgi:hypothetical protein